jgi:lysophospholipase L1-like esterase
MNGEKRESKKRFEKNLQELILKAEQRVLKRDIYFIGLTGVDNEIIIDEWEESRLQEFDRIIQKVAEENNCNFISMQGLLGKEDLADGLHPNAQGHEKIFQRVKEYLEI